MNKKRLITSALPYVNNIPHLGNIIGCVLSADVFYKYSTIAGYDAIHIGGTDEHGTTTETRAKQEGISPRALCDKYHAIHKDIYDWFDIEFTRFGRTSSPLHGKIVQELFLSLYQKGYIAQETLTQPFCSRCDTFLADRFIEGTCPYCGAEDARGDQCDRCGKLLDPSQLITPVCTTCGTRPGFKETTHLFLDLEKAQPEVEKWFEKSSGDGHWSHNALTVTKGWLKQGLQKRCITRDLEWGIPVPLEGFEDKVFYVWFDAPIGYVSITAEAKEDWEDWGKRPDEVELYQFLGKDNIPFHSVIFPATSFC